MLSWWYPVVRVKVEEGCQVTPGLEKINKGYIYLVAQPKVSDTSDTISFSWWLASRIARLLWLVTVIFSNQGLHSFLGLGERLGARRGVSKSSSHLRLAGWQEQS